MNKENGYSASYFLAMCCLKQSTSVKNHSLDNFFSVAKVEPDISIATRSFIVHLISSPSTQIAVDRKNDVMLLLHGEIYSTKDNQAEFLLKQFINRGIDFSRDINGSFVVLLIDKRNDTVAVVTDRINTRKVFCSRYKEGIWLSTSLYLHPTADVDLDPIGIACYLANGVVHNNRTLFDGVQTLERAHVHILTQDGFHATRYWSYEFTNSDPEINEKELRAELSELLVESVRIRLQDNPKVFLSLSGGYDSTGVLGILGSKLKVRDVDCFTCALGEPKPNSDEYISMKMAEHLGYNHKIVESYKGNFLDVLYHNARLGHGLANFCDEVDAWIEMASDFFLTTPSVLFVGDECFGWTDCELNCIMDILNSVAIYDFNRLSWLQNMLPKGTYDVLFNGLKEDMLQILKRCPTTRDRHDSRDFLYLDQRLNNVILPWREFFAGQFVVVRNPFLDNSILDFMKKIPSYLRRGKRLYKATISEMFPDLFQIERAATASYVPDWEEELNSERSAIEALISSQDSKLDRIIPPEVILRLLGGSRTGGDNRFSLKKLSRKLARRLLKETFMAEKILSRFHNTSKKQIGHTTFLKRILVIRLFLSKTDDT